MKTFQDLIERSYTAIKKRGKIDGLTNPYEFIDKMNEELNELVNEYYSYFNADDEKKYIQEVADLATVCIMQIKHLGYDFEKEFEKVVIKNETRKD